MVNSSLNKFLFWASGYLRCRIIFDSSDENAGRPYLERYFLFSIFGRHVYLHRFLASDTAPLHDHPWRWALSLIICGAYDETRRWGKARVRFWNWLTGESFHRIDLIPGVYTWTIFTVGPRCKKWGMFYPLGIKNSYVWAPYDYGEVGKNEDAVAASWWTTYPKGRFSTREKVDYAS